MAARSRVAVAEVNTVLAHSLIYYSQRQFSFRPVTREQLSGAEAFDAVIMENVDPGLLRDDWLAARSLSRERQCPVLVVTESPETPYSAPSKFGPVSPGDHAVVVFIKKPVYVPVLLKRLETILASKRMAEGFKHILRETRKISLALIRNEQARQKQAAAVGD
jgi:hypothetical protein